MAYLAVSILEFKKVKSCSHFERYLARLFSSGNLADRDASLLFVKLDNETEQ